MGPGDCRIAACVCRAVPKGLQAENVWKEDWVEGGLRGGMTQLLCTEAVRCTAHFIDWRASPACNKNPVPTQQKCQAPAAIWRLPSGARCRTLATYASTICDEFIPLSSCRPSCCAPVLPPGFAATFLESGVLPSRPTSSLPTIRNTQLVARRYGGATVYVGMQLGAAPNLDSPAGDR